MTLSMQLGGRILSLALKLSFYAATCTFFLHTAAKQNKALKT